MTLLFQFVECGNQPKDTTKIKKLLSSNKVFCETCCPCCVDTVKLFSSEILFLLCVQISPGQLFTLYFGDWPWKAYYLACPFSEVGQVWLEKFNAYVPSSKPSAHPCSNASTNIELWLQRVYAQLRETHGDKLQVANILALFSKDRVWKGHRVG